MNYGVPLLLILLWSLFNLSAAEPKQAAFDPAPLFPEFSPHYPLRFTESNNRLISDKELRLAEWNQHLILKPSWPALLALLSSLSLFFIPATKEKKGHQKFPVTKINGKTLSEAYIQVIDSSRRYLEATYNLSASTQTLEENLRELDNAQNLSKNQKTLLKEAYSVSETIKFNRATLTESEFQELIRKFQIEFPYFYANLYFVSH